MQDKVYYNSKMNKPIIIAEIAQGYEGSEKLVDLYIEAAHNSGADAIKFQIFHADELALSDYRYYSLFKKLELPFEIWKQAVNKSHEKGMEFYSDIFGLESFNNLEKIGIDGYKIHTTDINNMPLLKHLASSKKKIFLSTGGCQLEEIIRALEVLDSSEVTLMYGFQAEPTEIEDNNLKRIQVLKKRFNKPIGFQDHIAGESSLASYLPFVAIGAGFEIIEKHLTLSRSANIEDCISGMTPEEFSRWVPLIKKAYQSLGTDEWTITEKEQNYREKVRRAVCTINEIKEGESITEDNVTLKRTDNKNAIFDISEILNKTAKKMIKCNCAIKREDIK